jgi:hypothetical protein
MNVLKEPRQFVVQLGELIRPKNEEEKRILGNMALAGAFLVSLALLYIYLT